MQLPPTTNTKVAQFPALAVAHFCIANKITIHPESLQQKTYPVAAKRKKGCEKRLQTPLPQPLRCLSSYFILLIKVLSNTLEVSGTLVRIFCPT